MNWLGHTCRKYFAAGSKIGILAIFQFGFESFTIVKSTKIEDLEQISVCLVILQVQIWRTVALSTGMGQGFSNNECRGTLFSSLGQSAGQF